MTDAMVKEWAIVSGITVGCILGVTSTVKLFDMTRKYRWWQRLIIFSMLASPVTGGCATVGFVLGYYCVLTLPVSAPLFGVLYMVERTADPVVEME